MNSTALQFPNELTETPHWVLWKAIPRNRASGEMKLDKLPFQVTGECASTTEPKTWNTFEAVLEAYAKSGGRFQGVGFCFSKSAGFVGIDIDDAFQDGALNEVARPIVETMGSFTERSQSGQGIHVIVRGSIPNAVTKSDGDGVEMYDEGRFFALTGDLVTDCLDISERPAEVLKMHGMFKPAPEPAATNYKAETNSDDIRELLRALKFERCDDQNLWIKVGYALKSKGEYLAEWEEWSKNSPKYVEGECAKKWRGMKPNRIKFGSLVHWAREDSGNPELGKHSSITSNNRLDNELNANTPSIPLTICELASYVTTEDPNNLIGRRWLCKGMGALVIGQAGLGKSSWGMQATVRWALGLDVFGMTPVRPLRILYVQAENDTGDLAEMLQGVLAGLEMQSRIDELNERIVFVTEDARTGRDFAGLLRGLIEAHKPDLVIADPLLSYIGGNISEQETVSKFLRNEINPILHESGAALIFIHHTNKPSKDPQQRNGYVGGDYAYLGTGSAELANWARAVLTIREIKEGLYELRGAKRGKRSGLTGESNTQLLKHGAKGICWEVAEDEDAEAGMLTGEVGAILDSMHGPSPSGKGWRYMDVIQAIIKVRGGKQSGAKAFMQRHLLPHLNYAAGLYQPKRLQVAEGCKSVAATGEVARLQHLKGATATTATLATA